MSIQAILLPLFVQVALTLGLLLYLAELRRRDVASGAVRPSKIGLSEPDWSPRAKQVSYAFSNQFELPVLFYVLTILVIITRKGDLLFVIMAWIFVVMRILQAWIYITSNNVRYRFMYYLVGAIVLIVMWAVFMVRILTGAP
ncbi:MAG: MAPEG family protein [Hyphomicrobiales bacterium]